VESITALTARVIRQREVMDELAITTPSGDIVEDIPLPVTGTDAWDRRLSTAGFVRLTDWSAGICTVIARDELHPFGPPNTDDDYE
jgi:hypothetical protein